MSFPIKCTMRADGNVTRVDVYDDIGEGFFGDGLTAKDFSAEIARTAGPLDVHINSGGGRVDDGIAIANAVRAYKGRKRTIVDGMAASIASVIMQAGDERIVEPGSMVMIHDASTDAPIGTQADALKAAGVTGGRAGQAQRQHRPAVRRPRGRHRRGMARDHARGDLVHGRRGRGGGPRRQDRRRHRGTPPEIRSGGPACRPRTPGRTSALDADHGRTQCAAAHAVLRMRRHGKAATRLKREYPNHVPDF